MFRSIPENEAMATVDAAWERGTRDFDTAPLYGAGLSEIRPGLALAEPDPATLYGGGMKGYTDYPALP